MTKLQKLPPEVSGPLALEGDAPEKFRAEFAAFLADLESEASQRAYAYDWGLYQRWLQEERGKVPSEATTGDVQQFLLALREGSYRTLRNGELGSPQGRATRQRVLSVLRAVYGVFVRADLLANNPAREARNIKKGSEEPKTPWFDEEAFRKIVRAARRAGNSWRARRDRAIMFALLGTGIRRSEVARIRREDLLMQGERAVLRAVFKGKKSKEIPLPRWVYDEIATFLATGSAAVPPSMPVFPSHPESDRHVSESTVYNIVKRICKEAGVDPRIAPHSVRRTYITETGRRGVSLKARQAAVGHTSQKTTERYDKAQVLFDEVPGDALEDLVAEEGEET